MTAVRRAYPGVATIGSVMVFAAAVETTGLVPAIVATTLVATLGSPTMTWRHASLAAISLAVAVPAVFVFGLGLPIPLWVGW